MLSVYLAVASLLGGFFRCYYRFVEIKVASLLVGFFHDAIMGTMKLKLHHFWVGFFAMLL